MLSAAPAAAHDTGALPSLDLKLLHLPSCLPMAWQAARAKARISLFWVGGGWGGRWRRRVGNSKNQKMVAHFAAKHLEINV